MNELPIELHSFIFNHLNIVDLINCRSVNKKFKSVIDNRVKINELAVYSRSNLHDFSLRPINKNRSISSKKFCEFTKSPNYNSFNLKCFQFFDFGKKTINCSNLNRLVNLEQLEIYGNLWLYDNSLDLANLQILKIDQFSKENSFNLIIKAPKLSSFTFYSEFRDYSFGNYSFELSNPESIKYFETNCLNLIPVKLKNLEHLKYLCRTNQNMRMLDSISDFNPIDQLKNLKKLNFYCDDLNLIRFYSRLEQADRFVRVNDIRILKSFINYMIEKKKVLRNLKMVYLNGLEMADEEMVDNFFKNYLNSFKFMMINYNLLDNDLSDFKEIIYDDLVEQIQFIPDDFFLKFNNIQSVKLTVKIVDTKMFIEFLKRLNCFHSLELEGSCLDQTVFDEIPEICQVNHLIIHQTSSINLDFLLKFQYLFSFATNLQIECSIHLIVKAFEQLKNFNHFLFKCKDKNVKISRSGKKGNLVIYRVGFSMHFEHEGNPESTLNKLRTLCKDD